MALVVLYADAIIAMEACSGSNYWGRELKAQGFQVMLIPPQHVKPFVKVTRNKNYRNDAFAIIEAARRPNLQCVEPRTLVQTDMIQLHHLRDRMVGQRTAFINQHRGFLNEYGIVVSQGKEQLLAALPDLLEDADNALTSAAKALFIQILLEWRQLNQAIAELDKLIKQQARAESSQTTHANKAWPKKQQQRPL